MWVGLLSRLALILLSLQRDSAKLRMAHSEEFTAEVVGASGRMGTFFHSALENQATALPRGTEPGRKSAQGCPIYVATPSDAYLSIYEATLASRRKDLVLVGNAGLPIDKRLEECTILVPHFSVLYSDQWKQNNSLENEEPPSRKIQVNTDPLVSPPTYIYGRHAKLVASLLEANGIATKVVPSFSEIKAYSGRKLVCYSSQPLTVGQVHTVRQEDLERLVDEILPSLRDWLQEGDTTSNQDLETIQRILDRTRVLDYLKAYSTSISGAVPSIALAKQEFQDRNAVWLSKHHRQPFHIELLEKLGVDVGTVLKD